MVYPGEHITTQFQAAPQVLDWLKDRFAGKMRPVPAEPLIHVRYPQRILLTAIFFFLSMVGPSNGTIHFENTDDECGFAG